MHQGDDLADINGAYGIVLYLKEKNCEKAMAALER